MARSGCTYVTSELNVCAGCFVRRTGVFCTYNIEFLYVRDEAGVRTELEWKGHKNSLPLSDGTVLREALPTDDLVCQ